MKKARIRALKSMPVPDIKNWRDWEPVHLMKYLSKLGLSAKYIDFIGDNQMKPTMLIDFSKESNAEDTAIGDGKRKRTNKEKAEDKLMSMQWGFFLVNGLGDYPELSLLGRVVKEFEVMSYVVIFILYLFINK